MDYTTEYNEKDKIFIVRVMGRHKRPQDSYILQNLAREVGEKMSYKRFLFDMRKADIISETLGAFETGSVPADTGKRQLQQQVALVYTGNLDEHKFMETVAINRGYRVQVFNNIK